MATPLGYGMVAYGCYSPISFQTRIDLGRSGMGNQPYGWGGYGGALISGSFGSFIEHLVRWRRHGRR